MTIKQAIINKLRKQTAIIGIIGLGYVGLPLSLRYAEAGYKVVGFDIDPGKTRKLNQGKSYIRHISNKKVQNAVLRKLQSHPLRPAGEPIKVLLLLELQKEVMNYSPLFSSAYSQRENRKTNKED